MILASLQISGLMLCFRARFNISVRYIIAMGPRCFRCCMLRWSGPVEFEVDEFCIAFMTFVVVMCRGLVEKTGMLVYFAIIFRC